jgi:hypothetical protein
MNSEDQARELLNEQTAHDDGPDRRVGPVVLDVPSFRRRRLLGRIFQRMNEVGASEAELLYAYIAALAMPVDEVRRASVTGAAWEDAMDEWFQRNFTGMPPTDSLLAARRIFDHDMAAIVAATVEIVPKPGTADKDAPPNSAGQSPS